MSMARYSLTDIGRTVNAGPPSGCTRPWRASVDICDIFPHTYRRQDRRTPSPGAERILTPIIEAAGTRPPRELDLMAVMKTTRDVRGVGLAIPRPDGPAKVTGQTQYHLPDPREHRAAPAGRPPPARPRGVAHAL